MGNVVVVGVLFFGLLVAATAAVAWAGWRRVRRRNEVSPAHPTRPPLLWLASPAPCARLHRRLRHTVAVLRTAVPAPHGRRRREVTPVQALAAEVEAHAVAIDHELLLAVRARGRDGLMLRTRLADQIAELERSARRLAASSTWGTAGTSEPTDVALRRIADELDAREAAWAEVTRLERDAGLHVRV
jgi:hypothetical protein